MSRRSGPVFAAWCLAVMPVAAPAQDASLEQDEGPVTAEEALYNADELWKLNPGEEEEIDPCDQPDDPDVILICRESVDPERYMFERETRADSEVDGSGAPRAQDPGSKYALKPCVHAPPLSLCFGGMDEPPPPAIIVDFDALPETPEGSAAARWGGPTDADEIAARENRVGAVIPAPEEPQSRPDIGLETQRGIEDEVYGP